MQNPAIPTPETITCANLTWIKFDMRLADATEPAIEYCADGEGIFVVKQERSGLFLYHEGLLVKALGSDVQNAILTATQHLAQANPILFQQLSAPAQGGEDRE